MYNNDNLTAEVNSTQKSKEVAEFLLVKDGNGLEKKVINFENPKYAAFSGVVELVPVRLAKGMPSPNGGQSYRHKPEVSFSGITDKNTGMIVGILTGVDQKTKELKFQRITVKDVEFLDLSIKSQREKYICIKYSPFLEGSPNFQQTAKTTYRIVDKQQEADSFFKVRRTRKKAIEIAESLYGEKLVEFAIAIGYDPKMYSPETLSMEVIKFAENENKVNGKTGAERFMDAWDSDTRTELVILKRGLSAGVVIENANDGYMFNGVSLGLSEAEACNQLKSKPAIATSIDTQARSKQTYGAVIGEVKTPSVDPSLDKIQLLERQLEEQRRLNAELKAKQLEGNALSSIADDDVELAALFEEAKMVGFKSPHLVARTKPIDERKIALRKKLDEHILAQK